MVTMNVKRSEAKYQMLKLIHSGRTLREAKAMMKGASVALTDEYTTIKDKKDLLELEGGLYRLTQTRELRAKALRQKFGLRKSYPAGKEETLSKWLIGYKRTIPLNWKRDGNLIRRGRPNKSRPGSSKGKIGQTRVIGAGKVLHDFQSFVNELAGLQEKFGRMNVDRLRQEFKKVRTDAIFKMRNKD